jgi:ABC-type transport system involved in multi-copper enzyme maturation permease subunit
MRQLAILKDSFRETLDCKTFWVLLALSFLFVFLSSSVSLTPVRPEEALGDIARGFDRLAAGRARASFDVAFTVDEVREDGQGGYAFRLRASPPAGMHKLVRQWDALSRGAAKKLDDPLPDPEAPSDPDLQQKYLLSRLRAQQLLRVSVEAEPARPDALDYRVSVRPERPELLRGGHRIGVLFGLWELRLPTSAAIATAGIHTFLADLLAGFAGLVIAVIVTGSFVPDMLQKGRLETLLSRPIGRGTLLVSKYLGGLLYVFLNVVVLVGGSWLALALRTGNWSPAFLLTIPVLVLVFAVLYAFSVWVGVVSRSPLVAILCTMALWFGSFSAGRFHAGLAAPQARSPFPAWFEQVLGVFYLVLPKTYDLKEINTAVIVRAHLGAEAAATIPNAAPVDVSSWPFLVASTVVLLAVFLSCAVVVFKRRDY